MIFKRTGTHGVLPQPITGNGVNIDRIEETYYLGFFIGCNLSWKKHSDIVFSKVSRGVGILRCFKKKFSTLCHYYAVSFFNNSIHITVVLFGLAIFTVISKQYRYNKTRLYEL